MISLPSDTRLSNPATFATAFEADMAQLERDITSRRDDASMELDADEDRRAEMDCVGCSDPTEGAHIMGVHIRICPDCLARFVERESQPKPLPQVQRITAVAILPDPALWNPYAR